MPFKKGVVPEGAILYKDGNPGGPGRPRKLPKIDELLADILGEDKDGVTAAEMILKRLRSQAAIGNLKAAEMLLDRAYGKPKQVTDITTGGEKISTIFYLPKEDKPAEDTPVTNQ